MTENFTAGLTIRIRITSLPKQGEFDEFDLRRFRPGEIYDVPTQLASMLIIAGYAQMVASNIRAEAADFRQSRIPRPKK